MALTPSRMIPLQTKAPDFELPEPLTGKMRSKAELSGAQGTVIMFLCNHCPYVKHIETRLIDLAHRWQSSHPGIRFIAISPNDADAYPEDSPACMKTLAEHKKLPYPYLYDETQAIAKAYQATCTPDFFVFDAEDVCVYRGRFDESTPGNRLPVTGIDLDRALQHLVDKTPFQEIQYPSFGCNIKWRTPNA